MLERRLHACAAPPPRVLRRRVFAGAVLARRRWPPARAPCASRRCRAPARRTRRCSAAPLEEWRRKASEGDLLEQERCERLLRGVLMATVGTRGDAIPEGDARARLRRGLGRGRRWIWHCKPDADIDIRPNTPHKEARRLLAEAAAALLAHQERGAADEPRRHHGAEAPGNRGLDAGAAPAWTAGDAAPEGAGGVDGGHHHDPLRRQRRDAGSPLVVARPAVARRHRGGARPRGRALHRGLRHLGQPAEPDPEQKRSAW